MCVCVSVCLCVCGGGGEGVVYVCVCACMCAHMHLCGGDSIIKTTLSFTKYEKKVCVCCTCTSSQNAYNPDSSKCVCNCCPEVKMAKLLNSTNLPFSKM